MRTLMVINDTSIENHFGCQRVMSVLDEILSSHNIKYRYFVGEDFLLDPGFKDKVLECDSFIINGEGTIHHDRFFAVRLIEVAENIKSIKSNAKVSLINCTIQCMDEVYLKKLSFFDHVYVREGYSLKYVQPFYKNVKRVPDLSFYFSSDNTSFDSTRNGIPAITSSVDVRKTVKLKALALLKKYRFAKIHFDGNRFFSHISPEKRHIKLINRLLKLIDIKYTKTVIYWRFYELVNKVLNFFVVPIQVDNHFDFQKDISQRSFLISGRFHATCMALGAITPVFSIKSNSYKTEAVLSDIGLDLSRFILDSNDLFKKNLLNVEYTNEEVVLINSYLSTARPLIKNMFYEIV
ncbi:polysaccharide pyruvyl transferase family protein [Providencia hangzhouensis]|uniref:polysaccharide pyruvyl transferase family protein n=1 Tax=Providencia hangzhouensis TaxID=3031799 RepID=UPI0034DD15AF